MTGRVKHYLIVAKIQRKIIVRALFLGNSRVEIFLVFAHLTGFAASRYHLAAEVRLQFGNFRTKTPPSATSCGLSFWATRMKQITITLEDDGTITVASDEMQEPYKCNSLDECRQFVDKMLSEEAGESPEEQATEGQEDYGQMWDQEAANRKPQPGLMA